MERVWLIVFILCFIGSHLLINAVFSSIWFMGGIGYLGTPIWIGMAWTPVRLLLDLFVAAFLFQAVDSFIREIGGL